jgi:hypothetical protein
VRAGDLNDGARFERRRAVSRGRLSRS